MPGDLPEHLQSKASSKGLWKAGAGDEGLVSSIERVEKTLIDNVIEKKVGLLHAIEHVERSMILLIKATRAPLVWARRPSRCDSLLLPS